MGVFVLGQKIGGTDQKWLSRSHVLGLALKGPGYASPFEQAEAARLAQEASRLFPEYSFSTTFRVFGNPDHPWSMGVEDV